MFICEISIISHRDLLFSINIFLIRVFLSVRISDCDSDSILESNQKNSKNQSIHLF